MGVRGIDQLLKALPLAAAGPAAAVIEGLCELLSVRHAPLCPDEVRALAEFWERASAQVVAGRLNVFAAMDERHDVVPKAPVGQASAVFAQHGLGQRRAAARRDCEWARLLRPEAGDLRSTGAAYADGDISTAHAEVAVRTHRQLGATLRDESIDAALQAGGGGTTDAADDELVAALSRLSQGFTVRVRRILVVDVVLAHYARLLTVAEVDALAKRIVANLDPPTSEGAHRRRFLQLQPRPGGGWTGRFECGQAQGALIQRVLAAGSAPRSGLAIDQDGVEHTLPDTRHLGRVP